MLNEDQNRKNPDLRFYKYQTGRWRPMIMDLMKIVADHINPDPFAIDADEYRDHPVVPAMIHAFLIL